MSEFKNIIPCFLCSRQFQYGSHLYDGKHIPAYNMSVCMNCYKASHDGWAPIYDAKILAHLKEKGLPTPERQKDGYLPRDG